MQKEEFKRQLEENLKGNILPFWMERMVDPRGGFYGRIDGEGVLDPEAPKGAILNARILWAFSAAYRLLGDERYLATATRAKDYILRHFVDPEYGGIYWSLNPDGTPLDTKKQFYAIGFAIYGLSEYARATGDEESRNAALELFEVIEKHSRDREENGYIEAMTRDWRLIDDMRLSDKDDNAAKTMNTHLHIIEPYTNLLRVVPENETVKEAVRNLINIFLDRIEDPETGHLGLFFDMDWKRRDSEVSYGHDIEAAWLLLESAQAVGDFELLEKTLRHTRRIALAALEGRADDGSMIYERHADGRYDEDRHWWVQAENVVGQTYLWRFHDMPEMLDKAMQSWEYIRDNIVDSEGGEWVWRKDAQGNANPADDKAGFWKCPYHNSRMCIETIERLED